MIASIKSKPEWVGKIITDIAKSENREPVDVALDILRNDPDAAGVNFGMDEADVRFVMTLPWVATASDGSSKIDDGTRPHPRSFGTFSRKIGRYSIQENVVPLPAAIRSATGLPADILGMTDRGYLRKDIIADIAVIDPKTVRRPRHLRRTLQTIRRRPLAVPRRQSRHRRRRAARSPRRQTAAPATINQSKQREMKHK